MTMSASEINTSSGIQAVQTGSSSSPIKIKVPNLDKFSVWDIGEKLFSVNNEIQCIWTSGNFTHHECTIASIELLRKITNVFKKYISHYNLEKKKNETIPDVSWMGFQKLFAMVGLHHICTSLIAHDPTYTMLPGLVGLLESVNTITNEQLFKADGPNLTLLNQLCYGEQFVEATFELDHTPHKSIASSMLFSLIRILRKFQHEEAEIKTVRFIRKFIIADLLIDSPLMKNNESFNKRNLLQAFDLLDSNFDSIDHLFKVDFRSTDYHSHLSRIRGNTLRLTPYDTSEQIHKKIDIIRQVMKILGFAEIISRGRAPRQTAASSSGHSSRDVMFNFTENTRISVRKKTNLESIIIELQRAYVFQQNLDKAYLSQEALKNNDSYVAQVYEEMTKAVLVKTLMFAEIPCTQSLHSPGDHKLSVRYDLENFETTGTQHPLGLDADLYYSDNFTQDSARGVYLLGNKRILCSFSLSQQENCKIVQRIYLDLEKEFSKGKEFLLMTNYLHQMAAVPVWGLIQTTYNQEHLDTVFTVGRSESHPLFFKVFLDCERNLIYRIAMIYEAFVPKDLDLPPPKSYHVQLTDMLMSPDLDQVLSGHYVSGPFDGQTEDAFQAAEGHLFDILAKGLDYLSPWEKV